jgi:hypothetical protein
MEEPLLSPPQEWWWKCRPSRAITPRSTGRSSCYPKPRASSGALGPTSSRAHRRVFGSEGVDSPTDLNIEAVDGKLVITGERRLPDNVSRRYRNERWTGRFVRSFTLGNTVRLDDINADYYDGVLTLHLSKPEEVKPRRISINQTSEKPSQKQLNK